MTEEFTPGYVYHKQLVAPDELHAIITQFSNTDSYYFLRYSHAVSGICQNLPNERGEIEGQLFDSIREIRWKKYQSGYEVLILSKQELLLEGFEKVDGKWNISERDAYWYNIEETKFPKGFTFKDKDNKSIDSKNIPIKQRYFQDATTATIHFVALTVKSNDEHTNT